MKNVQVSLNHPAAAEISAAVGKFIVNFGAIEYETYLWQACQHEGINAFPTGGLFKARSIRVIDWLKVSAGEQMSAAIEAWGKAQNLAEFRNSIAHGPIIFGWSTIDESGPPDVLIVLDMQGAYKSGHTGAKVMLSDINEKIDIAAEIAQELRRLRRAIWA